MNRKFKFVAILALLLLPLAAVADSYTWTTAAGATAGGLPVTATMTLTMTGHGFDLTVVNLLADPTAINQVITGLEFSINTNLSSAQQTALKAATLNSSNAIIRTLNPDGTYSDSKPNQTTNWALSNSFFKGGLALCAAGCGTWHPEGIIGPTGTNNLYNNANPSITNNQHTPELFGTMTQPVTFHVYATGLTGLSATQLFSGANFVFGTQGIQVPGSTPPPPPPTIPEPATFVLVGTGVLGLAKIGWRRLRT